MKISFVLFNRNWSEEDLLRVFFLSLSLFLFIDISINEKMMIIIAFSFLWNERWWDQFPVNTLTYVSCVFNDEIDRDRNRNVCVHVFIFHTLEVYLRKLIMWSRGNLLADGERRDSGINLFLFARTKWLWLGFG